MTAPTPRPALKKAADAHIHPAAPGHTPHSLRAAADSAAAAEAAPQSGTQSGTPAVPTPRTDAESAARSGRPAQHRLSGPLHGTTSDGLRAAAKRSRRASSGSEKTVDLTVKVPKSLRKELRAAAKAQRVDPDEVVTTLLRSWLGN